jgi:hypothetical protein
MLRTSRRERKEAAGLVRNFLRIACGAARNFAYFLDSEGIDATKNLRLSNGIE